jgi:hypothetical protein
MVEFAMHWLSEIAHDCAARLSTVKTRTLAVRLPAPLIEALDAVCKRLRLRKSFVVEAALKEKIEDLLDTEDLSEAVRQATGFHAWEEVRAEARQRKHL